MVAAIRMTCSLLKLRIGAAVAASALAGMAAANGPAISVAQASALALAVLGASGAAGAFNHYYERDLDREMRRTRSRPFASGAFQPSLWWPISFLALLVASLALAATANGLVSSLLVFLGSFTYGVVYTVWLKRRSAWNIVIGGLAGSFAVLAGAAAVDPTPQVVPVLLALVLFLWTPPKATNTPGRGCRCCRSPHRGRYGPGQFFCIRPHWLRFRSCLSGTAKASSMGSAQA
jgi:protoheme IX farnesyltransferase